MQTNDRSHRRCIDLLPGGLTLQTDEHGTALTSETEKFYDLLERLVEAVERIAEAAMDLNLNGN
jgi:hypothetical protein